MSLRVLAALLASLVLSGAALAAEPVYPPGSRFGFEPIQDMQISRRFTGFERPGGGATVSVVELPPQDYAALTASYLDAPAFGRFITAEVDKWAEVIRVSGARIDE